MLHVLPDKERSMKVSIKYPQQTMMENRRYVIMLPSRWIYPLTCSHCNIRYTIPLKHKLIRRRNWCVSSSIIWSMYIMKQMKKPYNRAQRERERETKLPKQVQLCYWGFQHKPELYCDPLSLLHSIFPCKKQREREREKERVRTHWMLKHEGENETRIQKPTK